MSNSDSSESQSLLDSQESRPLLVVGIGASAGGLKALEQFFENMPQGSGAAFVVIQHLSPDFKSLMNELLGRRTQMGIYKVEEGMALEPNAIYLIPPGKNLVIEENRLRLFDQHRGTGSPLNLPIDIFFQSLAKHCAERSIGVILSGTGSDGTRGLQDIHQAGGIALVQDPTTAEFDGMPQSAINTDIVDQVAPPSELAQVIYHFSQSPIDAQQFRAETSLLRAGSQKLQHIISILAEQGQFDFSNYKPNTLSRRIHRRCVIAGFTDLDDYIEYLTNTATEQALLRTNLLISVTRFFRDLDAWDFIEQEVMPQLVANTKEKTQLRIWVTACATGEEAYSMAILAHEAIERSGRSIDVKIFATDVHVTALEKAAQGVYPASIANDLTEERLQRYFTPKENTFEVSRQLREMLIFAPHNLGKDAGFTRMSLVSCRNVLIYLQPDLQQRVLRNLHFSLIAQGILFLGESETLADLQEEFGTLHQRNKIFQKLRDVRLPISMQGSGQLSSPVSRYTAQTISPPRLDPMLSEAFKSFLVADNITCLIVDPDHQLLHVCGDPLNVLQMPDGPVTRELTKMVPPPLQLPLSTALHRAQRNQETVEYTGIRLASEDTTQDINLKVTYRQSSKLGKAFILVAISTAESSSNITAAAQTFEADTEVTQRIVQLEHELQQTRENLQATIEELETTNEEQQATNEELVASNEELQSTNEELHAVNEELYTVNAEYQSKIQELTDLNNDVDNLFSNIDIGVVFLDASLRIRKFTSAATQFLNLVDADVGRPLGHFSHNLDCPDLLETLTTVMETDDSIEQEVSVNSGGAPLLMRVHPYRLQGQPSQGVVLTFVNISTIKLAQVLLRQEVNDRKRAEAALQTLNKTLEQRVKEQTAELLLANRQLSQEVSERKQVQAELDQFFQLSLNLLCIADVDGYFKRLNPSFEKILGYSSAELLEHPFIDFIHPDDINATLGEVSKQSQGLKTAYFENRYRCRDGSYRWLAWSSVPTATGRLYASASDITELKEAQAALRQKNAELDAIFRALPDAVVFADLDRQIQMVNPAFNELFGYTMADILGQSTQRLYANPDDYEVQGQVRFNLDTADQLKPYEICYRHQDGETFPAETVGTTVQAENGETLGFIGVVRDIRDRKATERSIQRQLIAMESASIGIAMLNSGRFIYVNQAHSHLFGFSGSQALIDQPWQSLYEADQIAVIEQEIFPQLQEKGYWKGEVQAKRQDGQLFDEELSLSLTPAGDLIYLCQDITERKQVENHQESLLDALTRSNRDLEQFAYVASHDLREPLRKVKSFSELLVQGYREQLDSNARQYIDFMTSGVERMEALIQDLLTYSRLSQDTNTLVEVDLGTTLEAVLQDLALLIDEHQASITSDSELPTITANATAMQQLFLNLISNAIKFRSDKPPTINISVQKQPQEWLIAVEDNGIGLDQKFKDRIFVIFQRLHSRTQYPGTGIGLALCRKIIENLGGRIWVESEVGQGSTFYFTLPQEFNVLMP
ncbi:MAG: chemotaxis protein CheB [Cyanobacteria bacterium P01_A01_bin.17]